VAAVVFAGVAHAQTGTIQGKVVDQNGVPLQGVSVIVLGAQTGGFTNAAGEFKVLRVPVGNYTVRAIIASHDRQEKIVKIDANRASEVNFALGERVTRIKGIEVTGDAKIAINKKSSSTKQVVTSEDLRSLPA
jgi:iron complex outermembrane receptor protein